MPTILWLGDELCHDIVMVGGKAANLSKLASFHRVPPGFAIAAHGTSGMAASGMPPELLSGIMEAYGRLVSLSGETDAPVAVRSSAIDEDGAAASFAGQHDTYLNIRGADRVLDAVIRCVASARTPEALAYREKHGLPTDEVEIAVLVQALVPSDVSAVVFSANPINGNRDEVVVNASWGLGESIVGGTVTPDTYVVRKKSMEVVSQVIAAKARMTVLDGHGTREVTVPRPMQNMPSLTAEQAVEMARLAVRLEERMGWPADVECAIARDDLYLLQCRPITTLPGRG